MRTDISLKDTNTVSAFVHRFKSHISFHTGPVEYDNRICDAHLYIMPWRRIMIRWASLFDSHKALSEAQTCIFHVCSFDDKSLYIVFKNDVIHQHVWHSSVAVVTDISTFHACESASAWAMRARRIQKLHCLCLDPHALPSIIYYIRKAFVDPWQWSCAFCSELSNNTNVLNVFGV